MDIEKKEDLVHVETVDSFTPEDLHFTAAEEKAVIRKLDKRLLPLIFLLYTLSVLDRSNLGNAKLAGLNKAVDLSGLNYNWLGTVFYIAYITFQWTLMGWKQFKPHQFCAFAVFFWGIVATAQAGVTSWGGLMACRFFLGVSEAMFGPGVPLYLSFFYPRQKIGFRQGVFIAGAAMANAYGGALAYGISQIKSPVLAPWKTLFLIEGLPTILMAVVVWFCLPDSILEAKFLNEREKAIATSYLSRQQTSDEGSDKRGLRLSEVAAAFKDPKSYIPPLMYFSINVSYASLPLFLPTIIAEIGVFTTIQANGLSAPPYLLCFFMILLLTYLSDRMNVRGPFCGTIAAVASIGFILQATVKNNAVRYFATFLSVQIFCCVALTLAWTSNIHATESKRAGAYAMLATLGQCGPLLGTNIFPASEGPFYHKGMAVSAAFCMFVAVLSLVLSCMLIRENKKLERLERESTPEKPVAHEQGFRYIW